MQPGAPRRPARALTALWAFACGSTTAAVLIAAACTQGPLPRYFDGASLGPCEGLFARPIPPDQCKATPGSGLTPCNGSQAFALCNGSSFNECTCDLPNDYSLDSGAFDAPPPAPIPGLVELSTDASAELPCCFGKTVFELQPTECPANCRGLSSYAVCVNDQYTQCACDIPDGYGFSNFICDAGDW